MRYLSVSEIAKRWEISERTVRNYCADARIPGVFITGKTWNIPEDAIRPLNIGRKKDISKVLLYVLREERKASVKGGIYHKVQIDLTYNSNHIEGSRLTHEQTMYIFETNTLGIGDDPVNVDDIIETANHFRCIDIIIDRANQPLSESLIKLLHKTLKSGTSDSRKDWFNVGDYKKMPNEVGGRETVSPEEVPERMRGLILSYNEIKDKTFEDILSFHYEFESIHPFQDGNGRVGRLILLKECLRNGIVPFVITEDLKMFYYRGLREWESERGYLIDTCLLAQDRFKSFLDYFRIPYKK